MLEDLSRTRPEWEQAIINHPELQLLWDGQLEVYVLKFRHAAYYADFVELQYLVAKMPFQDSEMAVAFWAYENQLVPYIDTEER